MRFWFVLRWAARDLRRRWLQVAAIALVLAIGIGVYAGLGSTATWRYRSNDASFEQTAMYDLRVRAATGAFAAEGALRDRLADLPDPTVVATAEERLVVPTQVDASTASRTVLVPGRVVGVDVDGDGPHVNRVVVRDGEGRPLTPADDGTPRAVLERSFARFYGLPAEGDLRLAGDHAVRYVGQGQSPEYFFVMSDDGAFFAEANLAVVFAPLGTAQALAGRPGHVNDLVLQLTPGTDVGAAQAAVADAFASSGLGATVMQRADEDAYRVLYDDIEGDRRFWNVFAGLILAGAAFGAFNLVSRMVEAQRRELGIGMALGQSGRALAVRPLLSAGLIALLGAALGVGMAYLVMLAVRPAYTAMLPLPVWETPLQAGLLLRAALLGLAVPLVAAVWPVARAVGRTPVEAITTAHREARGGLAPALRRLRWPASAFGRMPFGNVLRTPRRTALTALGIGAALATLVAILGMLDSFLVTMDRNDRQLLGRHPDRLVVALDGFVPTDGPLVTAIAGTETIGAVAPAVRVGARISTPGRAPVEVLLEAVTMGDEVWSPTVHAGSTGGGVILAAKAAEDLGVDPGDVVVIEHPQLTPGGLQLVRREVPVAGVHDGPFRFNAYIGRGDLAGTGLDAVANELFVLPAPGRTPADVQRALFPLDGVASAQPVAAATRVVKDSLADFTSVFRVLEGFILLLVLLIAYNATSINADERARERATLFAFGLPVRRVLALEAVEGLLLGVLGAAVGLGIGVVVVRWFVTTIAAQTMPDMGLAVVISWGTILTVVVLGVAAVVLAPLLTARRLRRMDIPGTLRVVE